MRTWGIPPMNTDTEPTESNYNGRNGFPRWPFVQTDTDLPN